MKIHNIDATGSFTYNGVDLSNLTGSTTDSGSISTKIDNLNLSTSSLNSFTSSINTTIKNRLNSESVISGSVQVLITGTTGYSDFSSSISSSIGSLSGSVSTTTSNLSSSIGGLSSSVATTTSNLSSSISSLSSSVATTTSDLNSSIGNLSSSVATTTSGLSSSIATTTSGLAGRITTIEGRGATTGSNTFIGTQTITGSLFISSDLIVQGSSSLQNITASAVNIGANVVNLNTANPAIRFAGLNIFDSGSIGGSGSFLYDAVQDEFIFVHRGDNSNITSSVVLMGPQTYNNVGSELYPTNNRLLKGTGNEHVGDSIVSETGGGIGISGSLSVSGSMFITGSNITARVDNTCFQGNVCAAGNLLLGGAGSSNYIPKYTASGTLGDSRMITYGNGGFSVNLGWANCARIGFDNDTTGTYFYGLELDNGTRQLNIIGKAPDSNTGVSIWTGGNTYCQRFNINGSGVATFSCQICTPATIGGDGYFTSLQSCNSSDPSIEFYRNTCNNNVGIGRLYWYGLNSLYTKTLYSYIQTAIENCGASTFCSRLEFLTACNGSVNRSFMVNGIGVGCFASAVCASSFTATGDIRSNGIYRDYQGEALATTDGSEIQIGSLGAGTPRTLSLLAGNNRRLFINTNGNVGIGCTSPTYHLEVRCDASTSSCYLAAMFSRTTGANDGIGDIVAFGANGVSAIAGIFRTTGSWGLELQTAGRNTRMRIDNSGNVGIGCLTPSYILDVRDGTAGSAGGRGMRLSTCSNSAGPQFRLEYQCTGDARNWLIGTNQEVAGDFIIRSSTIAGCDAGGASSSTRFSISKDGNIAFNCVLSTSTGCIGIGTSTPRGKLHIIGNYDGAQNSVNLENNWPNTHRTSLINFWTYYNATDPIAVIEGGQDESATNAGQILFKTMNAGAAPAERMRITPVGRVGIGTSSPCATLDIACNFGSIISATTRVNDGCCSEIRVGWIGGTYTRMGYYPSTAVGYIDNTYPVSTGNPFGDIQFRQNLSGTMTPRMTLRGEGGQLVIGTSCAAFGRTLTVASDIVAYFSSQESISMGISAGTGAQSWGIQVCDTGDGGSALHLNARGGNVGINIGAGNAASYPLHVNGTAFATGAAGSLSDCRRKQCIQSLSKGLSEVMKLNPVQFEWKNEYINDCGMKGVQLGFIAQEVQDILPNSILIDSLNDNTLGLKLNELIPILVKSIQEQTCIICSLKSCLGII